MVAVEDCPLTRNANIQGVSEFVAGANLRTRILALQDFANRQVGVSLEGVTDKYAWPLLSKSVVDALVVLAHSLLIDHI